jgi:hypothetical protein
MGYVEQFDTQSLSSLSATVEFSAKMRRRNRLHQLGASPSLLLGMKLARAESPICRLEAMSGRSILRTEEGTIAVAVVAANRQYFLVILKGCGYKRHSMR